MNGDSSLKIKKVGGMATVVVDLMRFSFSLKPEVAQNIALHASVTARNFFLVLFSTLFVHSPSVLPNPFPTS